LKDTALYGISSMLGRFINLLLVPIHTHVFLKAEYGQYSYFMSWIGIAMVLFSFGMETAFFRFYAQTSDSIQKKTVYATTFWTLFGINIFMSVALVLNVKTIARWMSYSDLWHLLLCCIIIIFLDCIAIAPFSLLRAQQRPIRFVVIKIINIAANIFFNIFFLVLCPKLISMGYALPTWLYDPSQGILYIFIANIIASLCVLLFLLPEIMLLNLNVDKKLLKEMLLYASPLVIVGCAGMINEVADRLLQKEFLRGTADEVDAQMGVYSACIKLAIAINLFTSAFRMGAEPFFFKVSTQDNYRTIYATVMKYYVAICCLLFLTVLLFIHLWKYYIGSSYWEGLHVVFVMMLAKLFLGIYYNLTVWYKLTDKTYMGAIISCIGAIITIILSIYLLPRIGYIASAWAEVVCYGSMMLLSYILGQKYFPIPYYLQKLFSFFFWALVIYGLHTLVGIRLKEWIPYDQFIVPTLWGAFMLTVYILIIYLLDKKVLPDEKFYNRLQK